MSNLLITGLDGDTIAQIVLFLQDAKDMGADVGWIEDPYGRVLMRPNENETAVVIGEREELSDGAIEERWDKFCDNDLDISDDVLHDFASLMFEGELWLADWEPFELNL